MKKLPKPEKNLKSFILGEDAKIIDKTVVKVALTASLIAFAFVDSFQDVNAGGGHSNHDNHTNHLAIDEKNNSNFLSGVKEQGATVHKNPNFGNDNTTNYKTELNVEGKTLKIDVDPKTVQTNHGNHFNHSNGGGKS